MEQARRGQCIVIQSDHFRVGWKDSVSGTNKQSTKAIQGLLSKDVQYSRLEERKEERNDESMEIESKARETV
jgi:hypothetical protein